MNALAWGPAGALVFNALIWGVSWWPFRWLQDHGLHVLWATVVAYALPVLVITAWQPLAWREVARTPALWLLFLAAGTTNACFNWAVTAGDVVRVVLLFYLMPLWAVLLARVILGEAFSAGAWARVLLALSGAAIVLLADNAGGWPLPRNGADWLAVIGGFSFALNNVLLRREGTRSTGARGLASFGGGAAVSTVMALAVGQGLPGEWSLSWVLGAAALSVLFLASNLALQYGAAHLPANAAAVIMLTEVLFAAGSAVVLGASTLGTALVAGGALIVGASLLAARQRD